MADAYICRRGGSGGSGGGSELVIVGGTTRPAKAEHNTIWLNTPNGITSYALTATEPTGPVEGMAWITIGDSGAIKMASPVGGDWITVYPLSAKQYVGGAWVEVEAKSFQDGVWVSFRPTQIYFFKNGLSDVGYVTYGTVSVGESSAAITIDNKRDSYVICGPVSLEGYKSVSMTFNHSGNAAAAIYPTVYIAGANNVYDSTKAIAYARISLAKADNQVITLDISGQDGLTDVYVYYGIDNTTDASTRTIYVSEVVGR